MKKKYIVNLAVIGLIAGFIIGGFYFSAGPQKISAAIILKPNTILKSRVTFLSSLLYHLYNGSFTTVASTTYPGSLGGVDDYNNNQTMPTDSYRSTWTTCAAGNSYCNTGDSTNADKKDNNMGLVWSKWLDTGTGHTWFWANNCYEPGTAENPGGCTANGNSACRCVKKTSSLVGCDALGGGWRLPYQKELIQVYIDGSWGNLSSASDGYWSATTRSDLTQGAWGTNLYNGGTGNTSKTGTKQVRCVR